MVVVQSSIHRADTHIQLIYHTFQLAEHYATRFQQHSYRLFLTARAALSCATCCVKNSCVCGLKQSQRRPARISRHSPHSQNPKKQFRRPLVFVRARLSHVEIRAGWGKLGTGDAWAGGASDALDRRCTFLLERRSRQIEVLPDKEDIPIACRLQRCCRYSVFLSIICSIEERFQ